MGEGGRAGAGAAGTDEIAVGEVGGWLIRCERASGDVSFVGGTATLWIALRARPPTPPPRGTLPLGLPRKPRAVGQI